MIRTRFAPSPTGNLHVGGLRTALYAYLFARKNKGEFILRIEDTDQKREVEGAMHNLINTLNWMGLHYDEGPYFENPNSTEPIQKGEFGPYIQSQRTEIYREYCEKLMQSGHAYRCFCTAERLEEMREAQAKNKEAPMYDRKCADLPESEIKANLENGIPYVIRQKIPYTTIKFKDIVRGNVQFDGKTIDDQVLMKSDNFPTYHLANVIDDHLMGITHVIRGEEWLPSTPKHLALYEAFGWEPPQFAHLPLMLNPDRTKLSKRQGDVATEDYIKKGYSKEAILNFVVFLGWNPGGGEEREIFTLQELEEIFDLEKVHKSGAIFNLEKLDWFNWQWEREKFIEELTKTGLTPETEKYLARKGELLFEKFAAHIKEEYLKDKPKLLKALTTVDEKIIKNPQETNENIDFFFNLPNYHTDLLTHEKMGVDLSQAKNSLTAAKESLSTLTEWTQDSLKQTLLATVTKLGVKNGQVFWPLRAALSGLQFSPGVWEIAWTLGKEETLNRIDQAINKTT